MNLKQYIKSKILLPIIIGIIISVFLFIFGILDDAPGLCLIGLLIGSGLIFYGLFNIEKIRQKIDFGLTMPSLYCISGIILAIVLEFDNEITAFQRIIFITVMICIWLLSITAIIMLRKFKKARKLKF